MSKMLDVVMAGVISGIVAFTTSKIGIAGTVLGAVLGAMLFQVMNHYIKEPLENVNTKEIETRIVYAIPLLIIVGIEVVYIFSSIYLTSEQIFNYLENATDWTLFRVIGTGLIVMGIYPIITSEHIKKLYGYLLLSVGAIKLLNGFVDVHSPLVQLYAVYFADFGFAISLAVIAVLLYVTVSLIQESVIFYNKKDEKKVEHYGQKN